MNEELKTLIDTTNKMMANHNQNLEALRAQGVLENERAERSAALQQERWNEQVRMWNEDLRIKAARLQLSLQVFKMFRWIFIGTMLAALAWAMAGGLYVGK